MSNAQRLVLPSAEQLAWVQQFAERKLSAEEFDAYVNAPMSEEERREIIDSVTWFKKRYPTPAERLAAARRAYEQWFHGMPKR